MQRGVCRPSLRFNGSGLAGMRPTRRHHPWRKDMWSEARKKNLMSFTHTNQSAELALTLKPFTLKASVQVTPTGLKAITALVTGVLLASAVVVATAKR